MIARSFLALPLLLLPALVGCGNAAVDDKIGDLPDDHLTPSEFHRAGQPCVLCHGPYKGASPEMIIAGSVFAKIPEKGKAPIPVKGVKITVTDVLGNVNGAIPPRPNPLVTDCAGNFFLTHDAVVTLLGKDTVGFPLKVTIECPGSAPVDMKGRIARDGSCGGCHVGSPGQNSPGLIVCNSETPPPTKQTCPQLFQ